MDQLEPRVAGGPRRTGQGRPTGGGYLHGAGASSSVGGMGSGAPTPLYDPNPDPGNATHRGAGNGVASLAHYLPGQAALQQGGGMAHFGGMLAPTAGSASRAQQQPMGGRALHLRGGYAGTHPGALGFNPAGVLGLAQPLHGPPIGVRVAQMGAYGDYRGPLGGEYPEYGGMQPTDSSMMGLSGSRWSPAPPAGGAMCLGGGMGDCARQPNGHSMGMGGGAHHGMGSNHGMGGAGMGGMMPQSRAIFLSQIPQETTYEELCSAVGGYGPLESVKILPEKKQAFVSRLFKHKHPVSNLRTSLTHVQSRTSRL